MIFKLVRISILILDEHGNPSARTPDGNGFLTFATRLFTAQGTIASTNTQLNANGKLLTTFTYSSTIDVEQGQSGSGIWTVLDGENEPPRVLGVHSFSSLNPNITGGGELITLDVYNEIVSAMNSRGNLSGNDLPENAIIGVNINSVEFKPTGSITFNKDDYILGSYRRERIIGQGGDDRLFGGGGNDRLEGGEGVDQALFSDKFENYTYEIIDSNPDNPAVKFVHAKGSRIDDTDTTKDIEFAVFEFVNGGNEDDFFYVPLEVDPEDETKLKDGPEITSESGIFDDAGIKIGSLSVESPAWTFDGDINYTLNLTSSFTPDYNIITSSMFPVILDEN